MAAIYLHNEIFARTSSEPCDIQEHSRNMSTISSATLVTNTTSHSQPTEPLLATTSPQATPQPHSDFPETPYPPHSAAGPSTRLRWGDLPALSTDLSSLNEKNRWEGIRRESTRWTRTAKLVLDGLIVAWSIYNTIRYFIAFSIYDRNTPAGQSFSLSLGTSAGVALALILLSKTLFLVKHRLRLSAQIFRHLTWSCCMLRYLSSFFISAPAFANFVLVFMWRNSANPRYNIRSRCHAVDIDIMWSVSRNLCSGKSSSWGIWLTLSSLRLVLTVAVLVAYHVIPGMRPDFPRRPLHHRLRSESYSSTPLTAGGSSSSAAIMLPVTPTQNSNLSTRHQTSDATLRDSYRPPSRLSRPHSSISDATTPTKSLRSGYKSSPPETEDEHNSRFQSLFNQISQETDDATNFAASDHTSSPETTRDHGPSPTPSHPPGLQSSYMTHDAHYESDDDDDDDENNDATRYRGNPDNIYNLPPVPPALGYNEFGMPYPPDQDMRMLNGFIRRMPTIESMGSGEIATSITSNRPGGSMYTSSRPPTRNTLLSFTSSMDYEMSESAPPSRPNSLSARAEQLAGMAAANYASGASEHGELLGRPEVATRRVSSPTSYLETPDVAHGAAADMHSSAGSRGTTMSYHTATMGSSGDSYSASFHLPGGLH